MVQGVNEGTVQHHLASEKNGNSCFSSAGDGRRPYSHNSNASANLTAFPFSSPYSWTSSLRYLSASPDCRPCQRCLSHAFRPATSLAGGTPRTNSSLPL